ncbi:hypothetical protein V1504DRAFT_462733 [Lipomyces starkeyi]
MKGALTSSSGNLSCETANRYLLACSHRIQVGVPLDVQEIHPRWRVHLDSQTISPSLSHRGWLWSKRDKGQANHEIFGEPAQGLVRLPMYSSRPGRPSWAKVCKVIATWVHDEMKSSLKFEGCWMSRNDRLEITSKGVRYRRVLVVRLLAFLADPSPIHWEYLNKDPVQTYHSPFSHSCNGGNKRNDGQVAYCIIGLYHGRFATIEENSSHLFCSRARALCPGHGVPPVHCIFTHPDGTLKPCLNQVDKVPKCCCDRPCL